MMLGVNPALNYTALECVLGAAGLSPAAGSSRSAVLCCIVLLR